LTSSAMGIQVAGEKDMVLWNSFESFFKNVHGLTRETMLNTRKQELLRLHRPLKMSILSYAQTIDAQQKLVQELTPQFESCYPHQLGAELRERLVLADHVFLGLDTEIIDCVGRADCTVDEIFRIIRESPKLEEAARSEEDRGRRPGASYFVASENEDDEPDRSSGSAFSHPISIVSSGASSFPKTISSSVTYLGSTYQYSESSVIATLLSSVIQSRGGISKFQNVWQIVQSLGAETCALTQTISKGTQQAGRRAQRTNGTSERRFKTQMVLAAQGVFVLNALA
jgi:hypothetical protein